MFIITIDGSMLSAALRPSQLVHGHFGLQSLVVLALVVDCRCQLISALESKFSVNFSKHVVLIF